MGRVWIDVETCWRCAGQGKIVDCIEDPAVIETDLAYLKGKASSVEALLVPEGSGPPKTGLFD